MSNIERIKNLGQIVKGVQPEFERLAKIHGIVNYAEEASFAMQILNENGYLMKIALGNPDSLKRAVINVASIGLSLNPYKRHAYLVPRKDKVCLDISYVGYVQLAVDCGILKKIDTELVCKNDEFEFNGHDQAPSHKFEMFDMEARGPLIGGYVVAKLANGEIVLTHMAWPEIQAIRDRSESWRSHVSKGSPTPWETDTHEMIKKTLIKRARKNWPMPRGAGAERIINADAVENDTNPIQLAAAPEPDDAEKQDLMLKIRQGLTILGKSESKYVEYLKRINRRDIRALEDLTKIEMKQSLVALNQMADQITTKGKK